ncbi:transposase [Streptomyces sporangiiformans]|uniref:Transposase n=1 Tax=Streptomyces sporangiiformans TaxID=2315329 RepID=A0A505DS51_9ACTN|nr:transposase [Streptomyces sporangiiformans]
MPRVVVVDMGRGDLTDDEWERLRPFLPVSNGRCDRWRSHRQVIDGILHRVWTGVSRNWAGRLIHLPCQVRGGTRSVRSTGAGRRRIR